MICHDCPKRSECVRVCAELEAELEKTCGYLREDLMTAELAQELSEQTEEIFPKDPMECIADLLNLKELVSKLEETEKAVILGYFLEGKSLKVLAQDLGISRSEVFRRCEAGICRLRELMVNKFKHRKDLPFLSKFGYNKKVGNGEGEKAEKEPAEKTDPGEADSGTNFQAGPSGPGRSGTRS